MNTGQIISGAGHVGLIGWALLGNIFASDPIPFEVTQVTAISTEEFDAIMAAERPPEAASDILAPELPEVPSEVPELSSQSDQTTETEQPAAALATDPDLAPDLQNLAPPQQAEVSDEAPVLLPPQDEVAALLPETTVRPKPRPAKRVAPEQVAPSEPDVAIDEVDREETVPDEAADTPREEEEATAREEAATEIVTEAEESAELAPAKSIRPRARPNRAPARQEPETNGSAVEDALAAALNGVPQTPAPAAAAPSGPPLTGGEKDALRVAVQQCWNVGSLSTEALGTTVVVGVRMTEDAKPVIKSITMIDASGGSATAARQAFEAARRAIIRCGARGFNLPREKYSHWQDIEMTFNPEKMRIK